MCLGGAIPCWFPDLLSYLFGLEMVVIPGQQLLVEQVSSAPHIAHVVDLPGEGPLEGRIAILPLKHPRGKVPLCRC